MNEMKTVLLFALLACSLAACTRRQPTDRTPGSEEQVPAQREQAAVRRVDSLRFEEGCTEYTGYFAAGSLNRAALETVRRIVFDSPVCHVPLDESLTPEQAERLLTRARDSLAALAWPDGDRWQTMRERFDAWTCRQLERARVIHRAHYDPEYLLRCPESDSMLVRCAAIIRSGEEYVGQVRRLWHEAGPRTAGDVERELEGPDSLRHARKRLLQLLSNHINDKIHMRLGDDGRVDFSRYADDFLRLFDSVRVETWEP